ncbi:M1 family metallopeptidase [Rhodohalobacter sp. 8-1]|uniref:M1 family metallopeptidase n=1 Tax=Rhodohalobacter sp. 8-1 TaxID=3131972 RepID=UPI0030EB427B
MNFFRFASVISLLFLISSCSTPQQAAEPVEPQDTPVDNIDRPLPYPLDIPNAYSQAVENGTRTSTGHPGEQYWQNEGSYQLHAELDTLNNMIHGEADITYTNNSPDNLNAVVVELAQNLHKEGTPKKESTEITGGKDIQRIAINGNEISETTMQARWTTGASGYLINGTRLYLFPESPIGTGSSVNLEFEWSFEIPQQGASGRMGRSRDNLYMISYWYPQVAVYDDVYGWMDDSFLGNAEFYHKFSDYELSVTAPREWIVMGTGEFLNPEETLSPQTLERYNQAGASDSVVVIANFDELDNATARSDSGTLTWRFSADRVTDVAFSATLESRWDGARAAVGDLDGDGQTDYTRINSFYRDTAIFWNEQTDYGQHSVTYLSDYIGIPYPWPHMTSVEGAGIIGGGMEFPMMTVIGDYNGAGAVSLYGVTVHEIAHMWVPMMVSTNERRYAWIDEGHTTFHTQQANVDRFSATRFSRNNLFSQYLQIAGTDWEGEMMRWSDYHYPGPAYGVASYPKPASVLTALRGVLGDELFEEAHKEFIHRWEYKHPYPWDFFNTIDDVSGQDLSWFWRSWYYETWTLDQSIADVYTENGVTTVIIEDLGNVPMPVLLKLTLDNGSVLDTKLDVQDWLDGQRTIDFSIETDSPVIKAEVDPNVFFPDVNRRNNTWNSTESNE